VPTSDFDLAAWIESLAPETIPSGTGVLTGRIAEKDGTPVAGVLMRCTPQLQLAEHDIFNAPDLEEQVRRYARGQRYNRAAERTVRTDSDGRYTIEGLADVDHSLWPELEGFEIQRRRWRAFYVRPGEVIDFDAERRIRVEVHVLGVDGLPAQQAEVGAYSRNGSHHGPIQTAPGVYVFKLKEELWTIQATGGAFSGLQSEKVELDVRSDVNIPVVRLQLKALSGVDVTVISDGNIADGRFFVSVRAAVGEAPKVGERVAFSPHTGSPNEENDFRCVIAPLPPGRYWVLVGDYDQKTLALTDVDIAEGLTAVSLKVAGTPNPERHRADFIVVRVYGPGGELLRNARVGLGVFSNSSAGEGALHNPPPESDGSLLIPRSLAAPGSPWWYILTAEDVRYGRVSVRLDPNHAADVELRFLKPATLKVVLAGWAEYPYRNGLMVTLNADQYRNAVNDDNREFGPERLFRGLQPGAWEVSVTAVKPNGSHVRIEVKEVELRSGDNIMEIPLPTLHSFTFILPAGAKAKDVWARRDGAGHVAFSARKEDFKDGRCTVEDVPPGVYTVSDYTGETKVTVPQQRELVVDFRLYDCFVLSRVSAGGTAEKAGFRDGDKVVAIDGTELSGANLYLQSDLSQIEKYIVLRSGARVEITVDPENRESLGTSVNFNPGYRDE
jgi:hypothetical protein